jgi:hypothetical protein
MYNNFSKYICIIYLMECKIKNKNKNKIFFKFFISYRMYCMLFFLHAFSKIIHYFFRVIRMFVVPIDCNSDFIFFIILSFYHFIIFIIFIIFIVFHYSLFSLLIIHLRYFNSLFLLCIRSLKRNK